MKKDKQDKLRWYKSSENQEALSLTIRGVLLMIIPAGMRLATILFPKVAEIDPFVIVNELATLSAGVIIMYGLLRRIYNLYIKKYM